MRHPVPKSTGPGSSSAPAGPPAPDLAPVVAIGGAPASLDGGGPDSPAPVERARKRTAAKAKAADAKPDAKPNPANRPGWQKKMHDDLTEFVCLVGTSVAMVNEFDGCTIVAGSDGLAEALVSIAERSPSVKKALEKAGEAGGWLSVFGALAVIVVPIAANHGLAPEPMKAMSPYVKQQLAKIAEGATSGEGIDLSVLASLAASLGVDDLAINGSAPVGV